MLIPIFLREAVLADVPQVLRLARLLDSINLPTEEEDLVALIHRSALSFRGKIADRHEGVYLFVLEDRAWHARVPSLLPGDGYRSAVLKDPEEDVPPYLPDIAP
jgi:hypothetical protein